MQRPTLSVREFAELLGISTRFAYDLAARGEVRAVRLGRRVLIPRTVVDELLEAAS